jgi:hypothetical protein
VLPRLLVEEEDEEDDEEPEDVEGVAPVAEEREEELDRGTREVAACIAEEPDLVEFSADDATVPLELMLVPTLDALEVAFDWTVYFAPGLVKFRASRRLSLREPRSCGTSNEANRSAPVVPVSRSVFVTAPWVTTAVRTVAGPAVGAALCWSDDWGQNHHTAAAAMQAIRTNHIPRFFGFWGAPRTISGVRGLSGNGVRLGMEARLIWYSMRGLSTAPGSNAGHGTCRSSGTRGLRLAGSWDLR